jgi:hypothetical protein
VALAALGTTQINSGRWASDCAAPTVGQCGGSSSYVAPRKNRRPSSLEVARWQFAGVHARPA